MKPVIITVFDSEKRTTTDYPFAKSPIRIGRNPLNDLALPFPFVSGWHAVVRFDENQPRFYDLGSTNGTLYEGRRIQPGEPLDVGELLSVTIGRLELRLRRGEAQVHTSSSTAPASSVPPAGGPVLPTQIAKAVIPPRNPTAAAGLSQPPMAGSPGSNTSLTPTGTIRAGWQPGASQPPPMEPTAFPTPGPATTGAPPNLTRPGVPDSQPPAAMPSPEGTAHVQMGAVHQAIARGRGQYDAMRSAAKAMVAELSTSLGAMPPALRQLAIPMLVREYPELADVQEFNDLATQVGASVPKGRGGAGGGGGDGLAAVQRLSSIVRPDEAPPQNTDEAQRFLASVAEVLMAGASALIELQKGQEQFGNEMGVRVIKEFTPLHAAGTPENLLRYLLDWNKGGPHRTQELRGVYADLMIHQVALIRGIVEGARSLIARLDPREIERALQSAWPSKGAAAWKAYERLWQEMANNDRKITELVFGPDFARAYAEVGGEG